jgi:hypothetical protein
MARRSIVNAVARRFGHGVALPTTLETVPTIKTDTEFSDEGGNCV